MRTRYLIFLLCIFCFRKGGSAQWAEIFSDETQGYYDGYALNEDTILICGEIYASGLQYGIIKKSFDGGETWETDSLTYPDEDYGTYILSILPADDSTFYFGASDGSSYKTADLCQTYEYQYFPIAWLNNIDGGYFMNADTGLYVCEGLMRTFDGGETSFWISDGITFGGLFPITDSLFYSYGSIYGSDEMKILKSRDAGGSWDTLSVLTQCNSLYVVSEKEMYIGGEDYMYQSTDSGKTWVTFYAQEQSDFYNLTMRDGRLYYNTYSYSSDSSKISIGSIDLATHTHFDEFTTTATGYGKFKDLFFASDSVGYAVTSDGRIFRNEHIASIYTGVPELADQENTIVLFPNPANTYIQLSASVYYGDCIVEVTNEAGEVIINNEWKPYEKISVAQLMPGIYFYQIKNDFDIIVTGKFLKL